MAVPLDPKFPETIAQLAAQSGPHVLSHLGDRLGAPASKWGLDEMQAFRVIKDTKAWQTRFLSSLNADHEYSCPICQPSSSSSQQIHLEVVGRLRERFSGLRTASESSLYSSPDGRFRLALARLIRSDVRDEERKYSTREGAGNRQAAHYPDFVPSSTIPIPESSSPARPSSSEYSGSRASVPLDDDQNEFRARKPELLAAELAKELFYLSLCSVLEQSRPQEEYCFRPESHISRAVIAGRTIVGADDGGPCRKRLQFSSWTIIHPCLMVGECKPASQNLFYDDRTERYFPVLTIKALAQVVGEAVTTWKQYSPTALFRDGFDLSSHLSPLSANQLACSSVFSYVYNGSFMRFFHFDFGSHYAEYLDAPTESAQLDLVRDHPEDTCIRVASSKWLDLEEPGGVILSICHILTRLRLEERHKAGSPQATLDELIESFSESDYSVEM